jgi:branched-subunit amino acid transport protein
MDNKLKVLKYVSIISLMLLMASVVLAIDKEETSPSNIKTPTSITDIPATIADMSSKNPYITIVYIMGLITCGSLYFAWKQLEIIKTNAQSLTQLNGDLNRVIDNLNIRPCINNKINDIDIKH